MVITSDGKFELGTYMANIEKEIIEKTLKKNHNNVSKTSRELSISRQNLQYKIKKYNLNLG
ncbi:MAG: helix-turn-helix domain-containing protein [Clostridium sp.]|uniref:helix-turn-helix domain-containing protein n=1 Tax=Clostridium sp. TaxID=1506 RepID=UPI003D6D775D